MDPVALALIAIGLLIVFFAVSGVVAGFVFAVPAMKAAPPLTDVEREACRRVIREGKAYPFMCRYSVKKGTCPCRPCPKLEAARPR